MPTTDVPIAPTIDDIYKQIQVAIDKKELEIAPVQREFEELQARKTERTTALSKDIAKTNDEKKLKELAQALEDALAGFNAEIARQEAKLMTLRAQKKALEAQKKSLAEPQVI